MFIYHCHRQMQEEENTAEINAPISEITTEKHKELVS